MIEIEKIVKYQGCWKDKDNINYLFEILDQGYLEVNWLDNHPGFSNDSEANNIEKEIIKEYKKVLNGL